VVVVVAAAVVVVVVVVLPHGRVVITTHVDHLPTSTGVPLGTVGAAVGTVAAAVARQVGLTAAVVEVRRQVVVVRHLGEATMAVAAVAVALVLAMVVVAINSRVSGIKTGRNTRSTETQKLNENNGSSSLRAGLGDKCARFKLCIIFFSFSCLS
jgi:hypothetical protein